MLTNFATAEQPLRCSALPKLCRCNLSAVLSLIDDERGSCGAADTGSAVHFAARMWHTGADRNTRVAVGAMRMAIERYPLADLDAAELQFQHYASDKRNLDCECVLVEEEIMFSLPPSKEDPTQTPIVIRGTLDQVRKVKGEYYLWDIKTGSPEGLEMVNEACMQLVAYQYAASQKLGMPVRRAGIIRTKDYLKKRPGPVFWEAPWEYADVMVLLSTVQRSVADVRAGRITATPSKEACKWCVGLGSCLPRLREVNA